jgi:hypothetical protein
VRFEDDRYAGPFQPRRNPRLPDGLIASLPGTAAPQIPMSQVSVAPNDSSSNVAPRRGPQSDLSDFDDQSGDESGISGEPPPVPPTVTTMASEGPRNALVAGQASADMDAFSAGLPPPSPAPVATPSARKSRPTSRRVEDLTKDVATPLHGATERRVKQAQQRRGRSRTRGGHPAGLRSPS